MAVIVGELFARLDGAKRIEPDPLVDNPRFAIRVAVVIEKPGQIPLDTTVNRMEFIEGEHVGVVLVQCDLSLDLGEPGANVLDKALIPLQVNSRKAPCPVDR